VGQGHIHDFTPGVAPSGLFWTAPIPPQGVEIELGKVKASFRVVDFPLLDIITTPSPPATVSFDMEWSGKTAEVDVKDFVNDFAGEYRQCKATIEWSARVGNFSFASAGAETSLTRFAELGRERNGRFFRSG
jgi:hypothetical protein